MPIAALSKDTSRALTSSLVLNDAVSVVKELIDNALDARATAVSIEISANTLDVIQIKDNGSGIGVEDRQLLCKRGRTSKIRTIEDLAAIGGTFLGFRGEALASLTELSATVTITTRVDGEIVGSALKYGGEGKLLSSSSASHPVGTTVRIQDFLSKIPVRKQTALKATTKTLNSLRKLLHGYAFARPDTRFSLRVLKSKDSKAHWSYVPCHLASPLSEIASKIAGKEISAQCKECVSRSDAKEDENELSWTIKALLLEPSSDLSKVPGNEQHFSVDRRPVNADRGVIRDLSKLYKQYLRSACTRVEGTSCPSKPFLYIRITCPTESYDVNVEPAKDELLFYKPFILKKLFEELLTQAYGELEPILDAKHSGGGERARAPVDKTSFNLLKARKPVSQSLSTRIDEPFHGTYSTASQEASRSPPEASDMLSNRHFRTDEEISIIPEVSEAIDDETAECTDISANNPWAIAKMNVVLSPKRVLPSSPKQHVRRDGVIGSSKDDTVSSPALAFIPPGDSHRTPLGQNGQLPSPVTSPREVEPHQNPGPPSQVMRRRGPRMDESDEESVASPGTGPHTRGPSLLDTWMKQTQSASQQALVEGRSRAELLQSTSKARSVGQILARQGRISLPSSDNTRATQPGTSPQQQRSSQPFRAPFKTPFKQGVHFRSSGSDSETGDEAVTGVGSSISDYVTAFISESSTSPAKSSSKSSNQRDLEEILEFERQKRMAIAQQRKQAAQKAQLQQQILPSSSLSELNSTSLSKDNSRHTGFHAQDHRDQEAFDNHFGMGNLACTPISPLDPKNNSPHQNRYLAAIRDLDPERPVSVPVGRNATSSAEHDAYSTELPDSDPRGYLIRQLRAREKNDQGDSSDMKKTGLKIKRTKTARLPLETITVADATHGLATVLTTPDNKKLAGQASALSLIDEYPMSGEVKAISWDQQSTFLDAWQARLTVLIKRRLRRTEPMTDTDDELAEESAFGIDLGKAIQSHVARCGS